MRARRASGALAAALALAASIGAPPRLIAAPTACLAGLPHYRPRPVAPPAGARYLTTEGAVRIVGYNDMQQMLEALDQLFEAAHPGVRFELVLKGTRTAPPALAAGQSLFAPMGAPFEDQALADYRSAVGADPLAIAVAHDSLNPAARSSPIGLFVHPDNPLRRLDMDDAARAFAPPTGAAATRWGDLGVTGAWATRPIHVVGLADDTAIGTFMRRGAFFGRPFASSYQGLRQSRDVIAAVAADPDAIGFADLSLATPQARPLALAARRGGPYSAGSASDLRAGRYLLDRHLLIYLRRAPGGGVDPVAAEYLRLALSCEGQAAIAAGSLGYIALSPREAAVERAKLAAAN